MKFWRILFVSIIFSCSSIFLSAQQQLINGSFEDVVVPYDDTLHVHPDSWYFGWDGSFCGIPLGELTNESNSGTRAVKLETESCNGVILAERLLTYVTIPESFLPVIGHPLNAQPLQLSFYHKYSPVEGDTAFVSVLMFNLPDTIPYMGQVMYYADTVGYTFAYITEASAEYSEMAIDLLYETIETPQYIQVVFTSNVNGVYQNVMYDYAHAGTSLWIDDVELVYLNTSSENQLLSSAIQVFPNPVSNQFQIDAPGNFQPHSIVVFDNVGKVVRTMNPQDRVHSMNNLASGIYFLHIETEAGSVVKKLVQE